MVKLLPWSIFGMEQGKILLRISTVVKKASTWDLLPTVLMATEITLLFKQVTALEAMFTLSKTVIKEFFIAKF